MVPACIARHGALIAWGVEIFTRQRDRVPLVRKLELENHKIAIAKHHFAGGEIILPHPAEALVEEFERLFAARLKALSHIHI